MKNILRGKKLQTIALLVFFIILVLSTKVSAKNSVLRTYFAQAESYITIKSNNTIKYDNGLQVVYVYDKPSVTKTIQARWEVKGFDDTNKLMRLYIPKNVAVKKSYYIPTYKKSEFAEVYIMPKNTLKINNSINPTLKVGETAVIKRYKFGKECPLSDIIFKNKAFGENHIRTSAVYFSSNNNKVASVDKNGKVTTNGVGEATITMTRIITDSTTINGTKNTTQSILKDDIKITVIGKNYNLTYDKNTTDDVISMPSSIIGNSVVINNIQPARDGYEFLYWCINKNGTGKTYKTGEKIVLDKNITLYAIWNPIKSTNNNTNNNTQENNNTNNNTNTNTQTNNNLYYGITIYTSNLKVGNQLQIKNGYSWWTYSSHSGVKLSTGVRYRALQSNDIVKINKIEGNWLTVQIVKLNSNASKNSFKVGDIFYIYYGSTASQYLIKK